MEFPAKRMVGTAVGGSRPPEIRGRLWRTQLAPASATLATASELARDLPSPESSCRVEVAVVPAVVEPAITEWRRLDGPGRDESLAGANWSGRLAGGREVRTAKTAQGVGRPRSVIGAVRAAARGRSKRSRPVVCGLRVDTTRPALQPNRPRTRWTRGDVARQRDGRRRA